MFCTLPLKQFIFPMDYSLFIHIRKLENHIVMMNATRSCVFYPESKKEYLHYQYFLFLKIFMLFYSLHAKQIFGSS